MNYRIPLIRPVVNARVKELVNNVLDSGYLTEGPVTVQFENAVAAYTGAKYAVAFSSCTTGLETALRVAGIGPGDEVIIPDFTYPATGNAVQIVGATPVLVDVDADTMLLDTTQAEEAISASTRAIMPVSLFGNPVDYDVLKALREKYGLLIIEDAACSLGSVCRGAKVGTLADMSVFSFHPRKFITTGEGGIVTTDNSRWAEALARYKHFGMGKLAERKEMVFLSIGTNYKMSNILAAVGLAQMEIIDELLSERRQLAHKYHELLSEGRNIRLPRITPGAEHSFQSYVVFVSNRDRVIKEMLSLGIEVQIGTYALHQHPAFQGGGAKLRGRYSGSIKAFEEALVLPLYHGMTQSEQFEVVEKLKECVE
jgi:perosamine synthetase